MLARAGDPAGGRSALLGEAVVTQSRLSTRETKQRQRAQQEPEIAQGHVAVAADQQEAQDDPANQAATAGRRSVGRPRTTRPARISTAPTAYMASWALPGMMSLNSLAR